MSAKTEKKLRRAAREAGTDKKLLAAQEEAKKKSQSRLRWTLGAIALVLLIAFALLLNSNLVYKTNAFTVNGKSYTAADVNYRYSYQYNNLLNQYGSYISMLGIDTSAGIKGLASQDCPMAEGTWKDYFLDSAKEEMIQTKLFNDYAEANGISLTEEELNSVEASFDGLDEYAKSQGYAGTDRYLAAIFGAGVNKAVVSNAYRESALASKAYEALNNSFTYTADELKAQYESYNGEQDTYDYVYYYISAETVEVTGEDGETKTETTDETVAAAKAKADEVVKAYEAAEGEDVAERLNAAVASVAAEDKAYTQTNIKGSSLGDYKEWMTDSARKTGDITAIVNSGSTGCYVVAYIDHSDNNYNLASVRHILIKAVADENGVYTDEAKAEAKAKAEAVLAEFNAGDKSEESFAALAVANSEDTGSAENGGLYEDIYKGQMVKEFNDFCFAAHKAGDTAIVYGESGSYAGYHVMYFVAQGDNYRDYIALNDLRSAAVNEWLVAESDAAVSSEGFGMKFVG